MSLAWLKDCVYTIRQSAIENIRQIVEAFGVEWATGSLLPEVLATHTSTNYLYRLTALSAVTSLARIVGEEVLCSRLLPLVITMASDPVPNVRFNVAKTLQAILGLLPPRVVEGT
eukprot:6197035-Pleurochrysis_carterae.AAC.2